MYADRTKTNPVEAAFTWEFALAEGEGSLAAVVSMSGDTSNVLVRLAVGVGAKMAVVWDVERVELLLENG